MKSVLAIIGAITVLFVLALFAVCNDDDDGNSLGRTFKEQAVSLTVPASPARFVVSHDDGGDCDWEGNCGDGSYSGGDYGHNRRDDRNRNRGAFSPGPFDRSPVDAFNRICMPGATCYYGDPPPEEGQR